MGRAATTATPVANDADWYADPQPGARSAAWWLAVGRSPEQIVEDLVAQVRLDEDAARVAVERAGGGPVRTAAREGVL